MQKLSIYRGTNRPLRNKYALTTSWIDSKNRIINVAPEKKVLLRSSDGKEFTVEEAVAIKSQTIKTVMKEDDCDCAVFPMPNVDGKTLAKLLEHCKKHADQEVKKEDLKQFDKDFVEAGVVFLYDLIMGSNFLDIKDLLDLLREKVASMIRGKSPEEIRETFNIKNDFTPEEEEEVRRENAWAFD